ncbi:MAG: peptidylprolyl isomerase, partial [Desulfovibrionaceae bacterium]
MLRRLTMLLLAMALLAALALPAAHAQDMGKQVYVRMDTTLGPIVLELWPDKAPETVRNFLKYALSGFYEGTVFHRVHPDFMIQGGGFDKSLIRKEATLPTIKNEADNGLKNKEYTIAMARSAEPNSAANEFFINVKNNAML